MAGAGKDHRHVSSQSAIATFPPGTLNSFMIPEFQNATHKFKGVGGIVNRDNPLALIKRFYLENAMQYDMSHLTTMVWTGVCFRVDQGGQKSGRRVKIHSWVDKTFNQPADPLQLPGIITQIQVWIPELWFGKVPEKMADIEVGKHQYDIDRLPTFYSLDKNIPVPNVGQLVQVRFHNPDHLEMGGQYVKLLTDVPGLVSIDTLDKPKAALEKKCAGLGPVLGSGATIKKDNMAAGSIGHDLPKFPVSSIAKSFAFGNKAPCRGTHRKWYSKMEKHGLVGENVSSFTHYEKLVGNGIMEAVDRDSTGRETIIFFPNVSRNYVKLKPEIMFFFHDKGGFHDDDFDRIAAGLAELNKNKRNYIFVVTELPWSRGINAFRRRKRAENPHSVFYKSNWDAFFGNKGSGDSDSVVAAAEKAAEATGGTAKEYRHDPGNWPIYQKNVMKIINGYITKWAKEEIQGSLEDPSSRVTFIAVGSGGLALKNAVQQLGEAPEHIVMAHADHLIYNNVGELVTEHIEGKTGKTIVVMTDGISAAPLTLHSTNYFLGKKLKTPNTLGDAGFSYNNGKSMIAFSGYDTLVKNAISWTNDGKFPHIHKYFEKNGSDNPEAIPAATKKPEVPATLGQAANIPDRPSTPPKPEDALSSEDRAKFDNLNKLKNASIKEIKILEGKYKNSFKSGDYANANKFTAAIKPLKDKLVDVDKQLDELLKPHEPKEKPGSSLKNPTPGCPDANVIGTVGGSEMIGKKKGGINKVLWTPVKYTAANFTGEGNLLIPEGAAPAPGNSPGPQSVDNSAAASVGTGGPGNCPEGYTWLMGKCRPQGEHWNSKKQEELVKKMKKEHPEWFQ